MKNKGGHWSDWLLPVILGIIVLAIILFGFFPELFNKSDLDWEICRESFLIRSTIPEAKLSGLSTAAFKEAFPLKCKTQVITVDEKDIGEGRKGVAEVEEIIGDTMAKCWSMYSNGDANGFPGQKYGATSVCMPCARIHLTDEAWDKIGTEEIDIKHSLTKIGTENKFSYRDYLKNSGKKFDALSFGNAVPFNLDNSLFYINAKWEGQKGVAIGPNDAEKDEDYKISSVYLPRNMTKERGDLLVNYGVFVSSSTDAGGYVPYLFYFQPDQSPDPFNIVKAEMANYEHGILTWLAIGAGATATIATGGIAAPIIGAITAAFGGGALFSENEWSSQLCETWEGIPA